MFARFTFLYLLPVLLSLSVFGQSDTQWITHAGGTGSSDFDRARAVAIDNQGNLLVTGMFSGEAMFDDQTVDAVDWEVVNDLALDPDRNPIAYDATDLTELGYFTGGGDNEVTVFGRDVVYALAADEHNLYLAGSFMGTAQQHGYSMTAYNEGLDFFLAKMDRIVKPAPESPTSIAAYSAHVANIGPNPTNGPLQISSNLHHRYEVYGVLGNLLLQGEIPLGHTVDLDLSSFGKGIYMVKLLSGAERDIVRKIVLD